MWSCQKPGSVGHPRPKFCGCPYTHDTHSGYDRSRPLRASWACWRTRPWHLRRWRAAGWAPSAETSRLSSGGRRPATGNAAPACDSRWTVDLTAEKHSLSSLVWRKYRPTSKTVVRNCTSKILQTQPPSSHNITYCWGPRSPMEWHPSLQWWKY